MSTAAKRETEFQPQPICVSGANGFVFSLAAKPHPGHRLSSADLHQGSTPINSNTSTGLRTFLPQAGLVPRLSTYTRDSYTGLDYALHRYYASTYGRFTTKDNSRKSARKSSPQSWNRYAYASNDPANRNDPKGLCDDVIGGITNSSSNSSALNAFASTIGADQAFPYAGSGGSSLLSQALAMATGVSQVAYQGLLTANASTLTAFISLMNAAQDPGAINVFTFSGGAQAFASAYGYLPGSVQSRFNNVTYVSPGAAGTLPAGNGSTTAVFGGGIVDVAATIGTSLPFGTQIIDTPCNHSFGCEYGRAQSTLLGLAGNACSNPTTVSAGPGGSVAQVNYNITLLRPLWLVVGAPAAMMTDSGPEELDDN